MGAYDSVTVICPRCQHVVEFQSKARNCNFELFPPNKVPVSIAEDLDGETRECRNCMRPVRLNIPQGLETVAMEVT